MDGAAAANPRGLLSWVKEWGLRPCGTSAWSDFVFFSESPGPPPETHREPDDFDQNRSENVKRLNQNERPKGWYGPVWAMAPCTRSMSPLGAMATWFSCGQGVVVGGGLSGVSAANALLEDNAKVVLLDKSCFCGGNSSTATSGINKAKQKAQLAKNIAHSIDIFTADTLKCGADVDLLMDKSTWISRRWLAWEVMRYRGATAVRSGSQAPLSPTR